MFNSIEGIAPRSLHADDYFFVVILNQVQVANYKFFAVPKRVKVTNLPSFRFPLPAALLCK